MTSSLSLVELIKVIAPEMRFLEDDVIQIYADMATTQSKFGKGEIQKQARAYLAAHIYSIGQRNGNAGNIANLKEGDLQVSYSIAGSASALALSRLDTTIYGQEYKRLMNMNIMSPRTRNVGRTDTGLYYPFPSPFLP